MFWAVPVKFKWRYRACCCLASVVRETPMPARSRHSNSCHFLLIAASAIPGCYYCAPNFWLEEEYWRSPFLINFIGVIFGRVKKFGVILLLNKKWRAERKESGFCSYGCFWESYKLMCEKIVSKRAKCFCSRAAFYLRLEEEYWRSPFYF